MFRTSVKPEVSPVKIQLGQSILMMGSCFSEHIGKILSDHKFRVLNNPYGIIYNPVSIFKLLHGAMLKRPVDEGWIINSQGVYRHFDFHSDISAMDKESLLEKIEDVNTQTCNSLAGSDWLIITLGTAIVYRHKKLNNIVGNCHKIPAREFNKERLLPEDILESFKSFYSNLQVVNKRFRIILTVSPVRHIRDSLETNSLSKSILRYACNLITESYDQVDYFPSYEIMMDDLRDYRFYEKDMLHPSSTAIDYIWESFQECYFDKDTKAFIREWKKIRNALQHRPFYPESREHQEFIRKTIEQIRGFEKIVDITSELDLLHKQLK